MAQPPGVAAAAVMPAVNVVAQQRAALQAAVTAAAYNPDTGIPVIVSMGGEDPLITNAGALGIINPLPPEQRPTIRELSSIDKLQATDTRHDFQKAKRTKELLRGAGLTNPVAYSALNGLLLHITSKFINPVPGRPLLSESSQYLRMFKPLIPTTNYVYSKQNKDPPAASYMKTVTDYNYFISNTFFPGVRFTDPEEPVRLIYKTRFHTRTLTSDIFSGGAVAAAKRGNYYGLKHLVNLLLPDLHTIPFNAPTHPTIYFTYDMTVGWLSRLGENCPWLRQIITPENVADSADLRKIAVPGTPEYLFSVLLPWGPQMNPRFCNNIYTRHLGWRLYKQKNTPGKPFTKNNMWCFDQCLTRLNAEGVAIGGQHTAVTFTDIHTEGTPVEALGLKVMCMIEESMIGAPDGSLNSLRANAAEKYVEKATSASFAKSKLNIIPQFSAINAPIETYL
jgi:hypothetical protein